MVTGTETPEGTILMQARIIRDLRTENASLKTMVEKFTAERSKGSGTANNAMLKFPIFEETERELFLGYVSETIDGGCGPSTRRVIKDTYDYIYRKLQQ